MAKYKGKDVKIFVDGFELKHDIFKKEILPQFILEFINTNPAAVFIFEFCFALTRLSKNTDIETKRKYWPEFAKFMENQFKFGGKKYQLSENKEISDWVCELSPGKTGADWIMQTICKYSGRFINFKLERDLFKIATYAFIMWLKMGFHLQHKHDEDLKDHE